MNGKPQSIYSDDEGAFVSNIVQNILRTIILDISLHELMPQLQKGQ
jgi:hypothetical protein